MASWYRKQAAEAPPVDDDPVATRHAKRTELRDARRRKHEDRAERRRAKDATSAEPSSAAVAAEARATEQPPNLPSVKPAASNPCAGIYSEQAAQLANPALGAELAHADDMDFGDPLLCPVSTEPLCRAVKISGCGHVFSEASLLKGALQAKAQVCPLCRAPWLLASLVRCTEFDALVAAAMPGMARWRARKAAAALPKLLASVRALETRNDAIRSGIEVEVSTDDGDNEYVDIDDVEDETDDEYEGASVTWTFEIADFFFDDDSHYAAPIGTLLDFDPSYIVALGPSISDVDAGGVFTVDVAMRAVDSARAAQLSASLRALTPDELTTALGAPAGSVTSITEPTVHGALLLPEGPGVAWSFRIVAPNRDNLAGYDITLGSALGMDASDITVWVNGPDAEGTCTVVVSIAADNNTAAEQLSAQLQAMSPDDIATTLGAPSAGSVTSIEVTVAGLDGV